MFLAETKRKYFNIVFLFVIIIGAFWLYSALKPRASTNYDYYKYNYFKPLNKAEFIYFELVSDYENGYTKAFYKPEGNGMWGTYARILNDTEKGYWLYVIKKINPSYSGSEKMKDTRIELSYSAMQPYLKELEDKLNIYSLYYTGMNGIADNIRGTYISAANSPYWVYKACTMRFHGKKYKDALNGFELTYKNGISAGYARLAMDNTGIIMCIIAIIYSASCYTEEKRTNINGYIYTGSINSAKFVLQKYLANVVPLMFLSIVYAVFGAACFMYWNYKFNYGYHISIIPFILQTPFIIFPAVLITAAIGHLLGILFQSGAAAVIIQLVLFYLDGLFEEKFKLNKMIKYYYFDDYSYYTSHTGIIFINRIIMIIFSAVLITFVIKLFDYRREHDKLIDLKIIKKSVICPAINFINRTFNLQSVKKKELKKQKANTRSLVYYIFKQSVSKMALLYIPYLCIIFISLYQDMNVRDIALAGENFLTFASIFLFIRIGNMEQADGMESYVYTSNTRYPLLYLSRVLVAGTVLFIMTEAPLLLLCLKNHVMPGRWCIGIYLSALFIGMFALLVTEISGNHIIGYFAYIMYWLFDLTLGEGMPLSLSGYTHFIEKSKLYLAAGAAVITVMLLFITYMEQKGEGIINKRGSR